MDGAVALGRRIRAYWRDRGYDVEIRFLTSSNGRDVIAHVRSDLIDGLPQRRMDGRSMRAVAA